LRQMCLASRYSASPAGPSSRPKPDCFIPPHSAWGTYGRKSLIHAPPAPDRSRYEPCRASSSRTRASAEGRCCAGSAVRRRGPATPGDRPRSTVRTPSRPAAARGRPRSAASRAAGSTPDSRATHASFNSASCGHREPISEPRQASGQEPGQASSRQAKFTRRM
jgi:hypothetical protein